MKPIYLIRFSLFLSLMCSVLFVHAQQQERSPVQAEKISENLYQLIGGSGANGGFYIGDQSVLVIDAKMDEQSVKEIFLEIEKITDKPVKYLVNTHADGDHVTGNQFFPETVTIIAHENCRDEFYASRDGNPTIWSSPGMEKHMPAVTFKDKMDLYMGTKKVEITYHGIGHTTGDIYLYLPDENTAFIGDQYFEGRPQLIHSYKGGSALQYVKTMEKMLETVPASQFCSGHSEIASREIVINHMNQIQSKIKQVADLKQKEESLDAIKSDFAENESALIESIYNEL